MATKEELSLIQLKLTHETKNPFVFPVLSELFKQRPFTIEPLELTEDEYDDDDEMDSRFKIKFKQRYNNQNLNVSAFIHICEYHDSCDLTIELDSLTNKRGQKYMPDEINRYIYDETDLMDMADIDNSADIKRTVEIFDENVIEFYVASKLREHHAAEAAWARNEGVKARKAAWVAQHNLTRTPELEEIMDIVCTYEAGEEGQNQLFARLFTAVSNYKQ